MVLVHALYSVHVSMQQCMYSDVVCVPMFAVVQKIRSAPLLSKFGLVEGTVLFNLK